MAKALQNLTIEAKNGTITIVAKANAVLRPSKSGDTEILATTGGNQTVIVDGRPVIVSVNVYQYPTVGASK